MRWRRDRHERSTVALRDRQPHVLSVTTTLNRQTALDLADKLAALEPQTPVIIDLTAMSGFDSDGAEALINLTESQRDGEVSIVGFRQAATRLTGTDVAPAVRASRVNGGWVTRHLHNLVVVQAGDGDPVDTDDLEPVLRAACDTDAAIIVVDLRNVETLTPAGLQAITFASSDAAVRGQEMLVVNVTEQAAELLRTSALSATTYVAPEPPYDPSAR